MRTLNSKKLFRRTQKKVNKLIKLFNDSLYEDEAFYGRIYLRQYSSGWHPFTDNSGGMWYGVIRIYDKVTNMYKSVIGNFYDIRRTIFSEINSFVIEDLKINVGDSIKLGIDYRNVKHNPRDAKPFYPYYEKNFSYKRYD